MFSHSFFPSFLLIKSTLFDIKNSYFNSFIQSAILSNDEVHNYFKCTDQINSNIKDEIYIIEECVFDSIGNENSNGAIRIQNAQNILITKCDFIKCKAKDGGGCWLYNIDNITMIKNQFKECRSGVSGSAAFVVMNSHFNVSQVLISNCYEGSSSPEGTGIVYFKDSNGAFCRSSFINNTCLLSKNDQYAYVAFVSCPNVDVNDICFCYQNQRVGLYFMKIYLENCQYSIQNIVLPLFESALDNIVVINNSTKKINNKENYILNNTQNQICHIDNYVFEIGIPPTLTQSPLQTPNETPIETPISTPIETPIETPLETLSQTPSDLPNETPAETSIEFSDRNSFEAPSETPIEIFSESSSEDSLTMETDSATEELQQTEMLLDQTTKNDKTQPLYSFTKSSSEIFSLEIPNVSNQNREPKNYTIPLVISIICVIVLIIIIIIIILCVLRCKQKNRDAYNNENTESSVDYEVQFKVSSQDAKPNNPSI